MEIPTRLVWLNSHNRKKCLVPSLMERNSWVSFEFPSPAWQICVGGLKLLSIYFFSCHMIEIGF
jgi:hypothetical protein